MKDFHSHALRPALASKKAPAVKQVLVQRNPLPESNRMLSDAYHTLADQLNKFRVKGARETFDVKDATAFNKLINSLTTLQELERKNTALLELGNLSTSELEALSEQSQRLIASTDPARDVT